MHMCMLHEVVFCLFVNKSDTYVQHMYAKFSLLYLNENSLSWKDQAVKLCWHNMVKVYIKYIWLVVLYETWKELQLMKVWNICYSALCIFVEDMGVYYQEYIQIKQ